MTHSCPTRRSADLEDEAALHELRHDEDALGGFDELGQLEEILVGHQAVDREARLGDEGLGLGRRACGAACAGDEYGESHKAQGRQEGESDHELLPFNGSRGSFVCGAREPITVHRAARESSDGRDYAGSWARALTVRSEENTSELQSLMRISYA